MQDWEKDIKLHNLQKSFGVETGFDTPVESMVKARSGVYEDTPENRKHARVGQPYGNRIHGGATQNLQPDFTPTSQNKKLDAILHKITTIKKVDELEDMKNLVFSSHSNWDRDSKNKLGGAINKRIKELGGGEPKKSIDTVLKAFDTGLLSKDVFEKGKPGQMGEVRTWNGVQMKKVSSTGNSAKDWQPVKQGEQKPGAEQGQPGAQEAGDEQKPQYTEADLQEHAKNASEAALSAAIKSSPDPTVRQVAHAELARRQKEERGGGAGAEFPSQEFLGGGQKQSAFSPAGKKTPVHVPGKEEDQPGGEPSKHEDPFEKESKELQGKHDKEFTDHINKLQDIHKKIGSGFLNDKKKVPGKEEHYTALQKQHEEGGKMIIRHQQEKKALHEKRGRGEKKEVKGKNKEDDLIGQHIENMRSDAADKEAQYYDWKDEEGMINAFTNLAKQAGVSFVEHPAFEGGSDQVFLVSKKKLSTKELIALKEDPNDLPADFDGGSVTMESGDIEAATKDFKKVMKELGHTIEDHPLGEGTDGYILHLGKEKKIEKSIQGIQYF